MSHAQHARRLVQEHMRAQLANEVRFFHQHKSEWLPARRGQFVLIGRQAFGGFHPTYEAALRAGTKMFGLTAPFLIEEISLPEGELP